MLLVPRLRRFALAAVLLASGAFALPACDSIVDTFVPDTITFNGVEIETLGDASFRLENGRLMVTNIGASGEDGIGIWQDVGSAYLQFEPIDLPEDGAFGLAVRDTDDRFVASVNSEQRADGRHDIRFDIADRFDVQTVTFQYLLGDQLLLEIPDVPLGARGKSLLAETSGGTGDGDNGSVRVIRSGGRYVVGQDYSDDGDPAPLAGEGECTAATITLPISVQGVSTVCADLVQMVIESDDLPDTIRGAAITGRRLGSFTVTDVEVE